ncbi:hypothetical protein MesoLj131c_69660 (plasmid) [Mesorhizobium sp. 131-3-5]|nr:hypothetical protein MesoLj131c_69660 [Mesorhizobium sp. 131-3-5]
MNRATDLIDASLPIGLKLYAEIEVGEEIKSRQFVEQVPPINAVHTSKHNVATCNRANDVRVEQIGAVCLDFGAKAD